jgi:hypothetical protein
MCFSVLWTDGGINQTTAMLLIGYNFGNAIRAHRLLGFVSKILLSQRSVGLLPCPGGCQLTICISFARSRLLYKNQNCKVTKRIILRNLCVYPLLLRRYVIHKTINKIIILAIYNVLDLQFGTTWVVSFHSHIC